MGVMGGFEYQIRHIITDTEGEVQVVSRGGIANYPAAVKKIESVPGVVAATPYAGDPVLIMFHDKPVFPMLRGLDLGSIGKVTALGSYIIAGSLDALDDDAIVLSDQLAESIGATVGDTVEIYSPLIIQKMSADSVFLPRQVRVVGILHKGHQQLDSSTALWDGFA